MDKKKILIVKLGALGDVINTLPLAVHLFDNFNAEITWIVEPLSFPIIENHRACHKALLFDKKNKKESAKKISAEIKNQEFDFVLDLQRILKSAYFSLKAKSKRKVSFDFKRCKELTFLLPFEKIKPQDHETRHMLDQYLEFSEHIKAGIPENIKWDLPFIKDERKFDFPYVILNTGATKPANKWFESYFAKLSDLIFEKTDFTPVLTGGPEDVNFSKNICNKTIKPPIDLTGKTSIAELINLLDKSEYIISCDTGPMHLGVALGKKVGALFGPSNPVRTGPYYGKVIRSLCRCQECNKKRCETRDCMKDITPEHVFESVFNAEWIENEVVYA